MTIEQVQTLTGREFEFYATSMEDGNVVFCLPIPNSMFAYWTDENGSLILPGNPTETAQYLAGIWKAYMKDFLPVKQYRTSAKAGAIDKIPNRIPSISVKPWEDAITLRKSHDAHLIALAQDIADRVTFKGDQLYYDNFVVSSIGDDGTLYDSSRFPIASPQEPVSIIDFDMQLLHLLYGVILNKYNHDINLLKEIIPGNPEQFLSYTISIFLPDLAKSIGLTSNPSQDSINSIVRQINGFSKIFGAKISRSNPKYNAFYPLMTIIEYDQGNNTIKFISPYMNRVVVDLLTSSIKSDKRGRPLHSSSGNLMLKPSHSHHTKATIIKNRNQFAREIVEIIGVLLDQAGTKHGIPHISFQAIIDKMPQFNEALDAISTTTNKNRKLKRVFSKAWELLRTETDIPETFCDIILPDPKNPRYIPTMRTLDEVITFPHKGKNLAKVERNSR